MHRSLNVNTIYLHSLRFWEARSQVRRNVLEHGESTTPSYYGIYIFHLKSIIDRKVNVFAKTKGFSDFYGFQSLSLQIVKTFRRVRTVRHMFVYKVSKLWVWRLCVYLKFDQNQQILILQSYGRISYPETALTLFLW